MANLKISQLTPGAPAQTSDLLPIARTGANFSLKVSDILAAPAVTQAPLTDNTDIATTAYVDAAVAASGGRVIQTVRSVATSFTQAGITGPIALTFGTPFADNNYTVQVTVLGEEAAPETDTMTRFPSVGLMYITFQATAGVGVNVWVANNDSGAHTGYVHVTAIHD